MDRAGRRYYRYEGMTGHQDITGSTYVVQVAQTLWENLPQVLFVALLFNLICIPAAFLFTAGSFLPSFLVASITIGPAWVALLAYEMRLLQGGVPRLHTFFHAFRRHWRRSTILSLFAIFPLLALLTTLPALRTEPVAPVVWIGLGADLLGGAVMATLSFYIFPYLVQQPEISVRTCLRDALILASRHPINSVGLLAMGILFGFGVTYISLGLLLLLPSVYGLFIAANCLLVLDREAAG